MCSKCTRTFKFQRDCFAHYADCGALELLASGEIVPELRQLQREIGRVTAQLKGGRVRVLWSGQSIKVFKRGTPAVDALSKPKPRSRSRFLKQRRVKASKSRSRSKRTV